MAVYRLRTLWPAYQSRVRVVFRSLSLELKNLQPTPKEIVDQEIVLMAKQEPDLPITAWHAPEWRYVPTLLPAFEAEKAAAAQGYEAGWEFGWRVRYAFFSQNRTICMRHVLAEIARETGLDVPRFLTDWDSGRFRSAVLAESEHGWEALKVRGSPTFVLPSGQQVWNPGAIGVNWGPNHEILGTMPADCPDGDCLQPLRAMLDEAASAVPAGQTVPGTQ